MVTENSNDNIVSIKRGTIELKCKRSDIQNVDQTPDGFVFNLKGGLTLLYNDQYMPIETKEKIKQAVNIMSGSLEINLSSYKVPAKILG